MGKGASTGRADAGSADSAAVANGEMQPSHVVSMARFLQHYLSQDGPAQTILIGLTAGFLLSRAFAPTNWFFLIFPAFGAMALLAYHAPRAKDALIRGWWAGFGLFLPGLWWLTFSFTQQGPEPSVPLWLAPLAVFVLAGILSFYIAITFYFTARLRRDPLASMVLFAALWCLMEIARGFLFTGFPWHVAASVWSGWVLPLQGAYLFGTYGLGFITVLASSLVAAALLPYGRSTRWQNRWTGPVLGTLLLGSVTGYGALRLASETTRYHLDMPIRLVQASVNQQELWIEERFEGHFDRHMDLSFAGGKGAAAPRLIIWPESSVQDPTIDRQNSLKRWRISKLLDDGAYALIGAPRFERHAAGFDYYNSMLAIGAEADLFARYDKTHLVPFGEYMPFAAVFEFLGVQHLAGGAAHSAGEAKKTITLPGIPSFSTMICYEAIFPGEAFPQNERPEWLLNLTNDGWYGPTEGPYQHLGLSRMRAVEEGLPVVRSALSGVSTVIDPYGRVLAQLGIGEVGVINASLPMPAAAPAISSLGRVWILMAVLLIIIINTRYKRNKI